MVDLGIRLWTDAVRRLMTSLRRDILRQLDAATSFNTDAVVAAGEGLGIGGEVGVYSILTATETRTGAVALDAYVLVRSFDGDWTYWAESGFIVGGRISDLEWTSRTLMDFSTTAPRVREIEQEIVGLMGVGAYGWASVSWSSAGRLRASSQIERGGFYVLAAPKLPSEQFDFSFVAGA